jgi:4-hydroxy-3-methylbut-2-enyl diphosphate reductase
MRIEAHALRRGAPLRVLRTGMGRRRSERAAERLAAEPASAVAVAGLCGGLVPDLEPGDVVLASELSTEGEERLVLDPEPLRCALEHLGLAARVGRVACVDHVVRGAERERLAEAGALAVEMESVWLAPGAAGRPFAVLRVVLDAPRHEILSPAFPSQLLRALRRLRETAPALARWADLDTSLAGRN